MYEVNDRVSQRLKATESARQTALRAYIEAHRQLMEMRGGDMTPLPKVRAIEVGNVEIPPEIAKHIGRWSIPVPFDPAGLKRPEESW